MNINANLNANSQSIGLLQSGLSTANNNITTNFATKTQVSNNFNSFGLIMANKYATKTQLKSYVFSFTYPIHSKVFDLIKGKNKRNL